MSQSILNLDQAPEDSIERLMWLSGVEAAVKTALDKEFQSAYFYARFSQRLDAALSLHLHPEKRVLAWTRAENEARGRAIRWGDGY